MLQDKEIEFQVNSKGTKGITCGFISWWRLEQALKKSLNMQEGETLTHVKVGDKGIQFYHTYKEGLK